MPELAPGDVVTGVVERIMPYGAFVRLSDGKKAMIHISQLSHKFVKSVDAVLQNEQEVKAKVIKIDERGRIDLSIKALEEPPAAASAPARRAPQQHQHRSSVPHHSVPTLGQRSSGGSAAPEDFEKKLAGFMKRSEEKFSDILNAKNGRGGRNGGRRKGGRA